MVINVSSEFQLDVEVGVKVGADRARDAVLHAGSLLVAAPALSGEGDMLLDGDEGLIQKPHPILGEHLAQGEVAVSGDVPQHSDVEQFVCLLEISFDGIDVIRVHYQRAGRQRGGRTVQKSIHIQV